MGNVVSENTQLGAASTTDNQLFCYDEQNRLTWAGATGTSPCNGAISAGTLTSAYYSQAYSYDAQGRLTSGAVGSYSYGDSSHPHAVTSIGSGAYTASYDAAGDMTCRAPNSSVTCSGTPTGATLAYDAERRLAHWQNTPSSPTVQDDYLYDGEGQRVEQYVNTSGTITSTAYLLGGVEEVSGGVVTKYLGAKGLPMAIRVGTAGGLNYLATDGLGSVSVAVDGAGNVVASQLFGPYGASRYSSGAMPTSKGFTGQRADATSGLDYYGARYYDPVAGQFVSADSVSQGLSRYAYVGGNPETATDPSGHLYCTEECGSGGGNAGGSGYNGQSCYGDECGAGSGSTNSGQPPVTPPQGNQPNMGPGGIDTCNASCAFLAHNASAATTQSAQPQETPQQAATDAKDYYNWLAIYLGAAGAIIGAIGLTMTGVGLATGNLVAAYIGSIVTAIGAALATLAFVASGISAAFGDQLDSLGFDGSGINATLGELGKATLGIGMVSAAGGVLESVLAAVIGGEAVAPEAIATAAVSTATTSSFFAAGVVYAGIVAIGTAALSAGALGTIYYEEDHQE